MEGSNLRRETAHPGRVYEGRTSITNCRLLKRKLRKISQNTDPILFFILILTLVSRCHHQNCHVRPPVCLYLLLCTDDGRSYRECNVRNKEKRACMLTRLMEKRSGRSGGYHAADDDLDFMVYVEAADGICTSRTGGEHR